MKRIKPKRRDLIVFPPLPDSGAAKSRDFLDPLWAAECFDDVFGVHATKYNPFYKRMQKKLYKPVATIPPMISLADRIATILSDMEGKDRGKQVRLAALAGTTRGRVSQWLKNPAEAMSYEFARNIERELGYSLDWLMDGRGPKMASEAKKAAPKGNLLTYADMEEMILLSAYRHATPEGKRYILKSAELADKMPADTPPDDKK